MDQRDEIILFKMEGSRREMLLSCLHTGLPLVAAGCSGIAEREIRTYNSGPNWDSVDWRLSIKNDGQHSSLDGALPSF